MTNKPWLEPDLLDFWKGKKKVKLKAWLSLVLSSFRGKQVEIYLESLVTRVLTEKSLIENALVD